MILATSIAQVSALVRSGELRAIKIGGRGQWRIEIAVLEEWIADQYRRTHDYLATEAGPTD